MLIAFFVSTNIAAQEKQDSPIVASEEIKAPAEEEYDALAPAKAAFYSAVLPGLGQIKNKDWWKAPIVWGAIGTGIYFVVDNGNEAERYRTAFKERLAGRIDEFTIINEDGTTTERISNDGLIDAQEFFRKQRETAILVTVGLYILQIVEANVDAHLSQFDVDDRLSLNTVIDLNTLLQPTYGLRLTYQLD